LFISSSNFSIGYAHAISVNVHFSLSIITFPGVPVTPNNCHPSCVLCVIFDINLSEFIQVVNLDSLIHNSFAKAVAPATDLSSKSNHFDI